ncbi:MAG: hypothetical protein HY645_15010 [Acidobacteria bacterium]|nr:hypothetical protein [Acidobacteriota bacterium]
MKNIYCQLFLLIILLVGTSNAGDMASTFKAAIWLSPEIFGAEHPIVLVQGQKYEFEVRTIYWEPVTNVYWAVTSRLTPFFGDKPHFLVNYLEPERGYTIKYTVEVPRDFPPGKYTGLMMLVARQGNDPGNSNKTALSPIAGKLGLVFEILQAPE